MIEMRSDENISSLCHLSKNLYNEANYLIDNENPNVVVFENL
jgi:hypothetical protein